MAKDKTEACRDAAHDLAATDPAPAHQDPTTETPVTEDQTEAAGHEPEDINSVNPRSPGYRTPMEGSIYSDAMETELSMAEADLLLVVAEKLAARLSQKIITEVITSPPANALDTASSDKTNSNAGVVDALLEAITDDSRATVARNTELLDAFEQFLQQEYVEITTADAEEEDLTPEVGEDPLVSLCVPIEDSDTEEEPEDEGNATVRASGSGSDEFGDDGWESLELPEVTKVPDLVGEA